MSRRRNPAGSPRRRQPADATADVPADRLLSRANLAWLGAVVGVMAVYRLAMLAANPGPPGSDPGNWLAYTRQLFGEPVKAADSMYFPGMLVLLKGFMAFFPDLTALKLAAVVASVSAGVPFFLIARRSCSAPAAAGLTVGLLMAGYHIEMLNWGGYPQLLATGFLLTSFLFLDDGLVTGDRRALVAAGVFAGAVAGTHHFTVLILVASATVYLPWMAYRFRAGLGSFGRRVGVWCMASVATSLLFVPWYVRYLRLESGGGALNANGADLSRLGDVLSNVFGEAPLTWLFLLVVVPLLSLVPLGGAGAGRARPLGVALVLGPLAVFAATRESRAFEPMQAGMLLCLATVVATVEAYLRTRREATAAFALGGLTYGMAAVALLAILAINGNARFQIARDAYVAVDQDALDALDWVKANTPQDSIFLAGGRGPVVNYAWWVEGYAQRPTYTPTDVAFLAFKEEKEQAALALDLVRPETSREEARVLLERSGIGYLFIYKPAGGYFQDLVNKVPVYLSFENGSFVVLRVAPAESASSQ